jgi:thiosulfate reductase cytochrome b subunit
MNHQADKPHGAAGGIVMLRRHALVTRLTHWLNVVCFCVLAASGMQIFNAWPQLYWGQEGADASRALIALQAFPGWLTLPSWQDLAAGRRWHLFFAWCFVVNGAAYLAYAVFSGHLRRDLLPRGGELAPRHLWREVLDHARLRFPRDERARHYNTLQKLSYLGVIGLLLPMMLLTGLSMSPAMNAVLPWLPELFGGRQSARTLHFASAALLVLFVLVHLAMVVLSGPWNNLRSMLSGRYAIHVGRPHE